MGLAGKQNSRGVCSHVSLDQVIVHRAHSSVQVHSCLCNHDAGCLAWAVLPLRSVQLQQA